MDGRPLLRPELSIASKSTGVVRMRLILFELGGSVEEGAGGSSLDIAEVSMA